MDAVLSLIRGKSANNLRIRRRTTTGASQWSSTPHARFLFARVGWMKWYQGSQPGDERPINGGAYNRANKGFELNNFLPGDSRLLGYYQPSMRSKYDETALQRIDPSATGKTELGDVTVVFVARKPGGGQVIVGWYKKATVFRRLQAFQSPLGAISTGFRCVGLVDDAVLLPLSRRFFDVPKGHGGIGQANVCYTLDRNGHPKASAWIQQARHFINRYKGENLLVSEEDFDVRNKSKKPARGQGFRVDAVERKAIEMLGMQKAKRYFTSLGYQKVEDVSARESFDLVCTKTGTNPLRVEVKATTQSGESVVISHGEAMNAANKHQQTALFILHSVMLRGKIATGGTQFVLNPWPFDWAHTTPISHTYRVPI